MPLLSLSTLTLMSSTTFAFFRKRRIKKKLPRDCMQDTYAFVVIVLQNYDLFYCNLNYEKCGSFSVI
jgi:hypothetical protein